MACPGQARPGKNGTFVLMSTGGFAQPDVSPCSYMFILQLLGVPDQHVGPAVLAIDFVLVGVEPVAGGVQLIPSGSGCAGAVHLRAVLERRGFV